MDPECKSYIGQNTKTLLNRFERAKKNKYLKPCLEHQKDFTPLVYTTDGIPGTETLAAEKKLASLLASRLQRTYSEMAFYVRARMTIAVLRCNTLLLRTSRDRRHMRRIILHDGAPLTVMKLLHDL